MTIELACLIEGSYSINSLAEKGVSIADLKLIRETLSIPQNKLDDKIFYVGFIELKDRLFVSLPKSLERSHIDKNCAKVLMALLRNVAKRKNVTSRIPDRAYLTTAERISHATQINLAEFIINDFLCNGDIRFRLFKQSANNVHDPDWVRTIDLYQPIISGSSHIYDRWTSKRRQTQQEKIINEIHRAVLYQCLNKYGSILGKEAELKNLSHVINVPRNAIPLISSKMREVYGQREVLVLKAIKRWLEIDGETASVEFFGTQYFHIIWEEVCSFLMHNCKLKEEWTLPFERPIWNYLDSGVQTNGDPFEVDIISEKHTSKLLLADAKYYNINQRSRGILGVNDVAKQINYETQLVQSSSYLLKYLDVNNLVNLFIFPGDHAGKFCNPLCKVKFPNLYSKNLYGFTFDTIESFERYCRQEPLSSSEVDAIATIH